VVGRVIEIHRFILVVDLFPVVWRVTGGYDDRWFMVSRKTFPLFNLDQPALFNIGATDTAGVGMEHNAFANHKTIVEHGRFQFANRNSTPNTYHGGRFIVSLETFRAYLIRFAKKLPHEKRIATQEAGDDLAGKRVPAGVEKQQMIIAQNRELFPCGVHYHTCLF